MAVSTVPLAEPAEHQRYRARGLWEDAFRRLIRNRLALVGLLILVVFAVAAVLAPLIAPFDPNEQNYDAIFQSPNATHIAGTDNLGRDWFSRLVYGARLSLTVGIFAQAIVLMIGVAIGTTAGYFGGQIDNLLMRFTDLMYAFPDLLFIILLRTVFSEGILHEFGINILSRDTEQIFTLFFIIGLINWTGDARLVRGQILSLKEREFVEAARSIGASNAQIMWRHLFPNTLGPLIVVVTLGIPRAVFAEAALSFIGIGVGPSIPSWGSMVQEGYSAIFGSPHLVLFPAGAIALLMLSFTFLGDGLRDALDPRTR
ncbi:MAG TPA: ABC transporter permease [Dehalococcoidia bacterium]|nr:ABC transporter permease [Dehalococcoidia bacterium]